MRALLAVLLAICLAAGNASARSLKNNGPEPVDTTAFAQADTETSASGTNGAATSGGSVATEGVGTVTAGTAFNLAGTVGNGDSETAAETDATVVIEKPGVVFISAAATTNADCDSTGTQGCVTGSGTTATGIDIGNAVQFANSGALSFSRVSSEQVPLSVVPPEFPVKEDEEEEEE